MKPAWRSALERRDPQLLTTRHAVRITVVACLCFYGCRYGLRDPGMATYAIFAVVAAGGLSQLAGPPVQRAASLVAALPAAYCLVAAGTLLAGTTWEAALGMFAVGFAVSYSGVGGPRLVGLTNGLQLFYILPCFPPYEPQTLPARLIGVTLGVGLLALAELTLWPDPPPVRHQDRLARAADGLAACADALTGAAMGYRVASNDAARLLGQCGPALDQLRPSRLPAMERPASAGARDRALSHAGALLRYTAQQMARLVPLSARSGPVPAAVPLLDGMAAALRHCAASLAGTVTPRGTEDLDAVIARFNASRAESAGPGMGPRDAAYLGAVALGAADGVRSLLLATQVVRGAPLPPDETPPEQRPGPFWYAYRPAPVLWWHRFRGHLTPRSVYFQNALRTALALAAARVAAGLLHLSHGFWVLLATLTLLRGSAADTRTQLRPALVGTLAGAAATAVVLLLVGDRPAFYVAALPPVMLLAFAVGPLLGLAWGQGLFTVLVALLFSQLAPASWQLAEARLVDVLVGAAIGGLTGLCAWPRGGGGEMRRDVADFLGSAAAVVWECAAAVTGREAAGSVLPQARHAMLLASTSYAQYQAERSDPRMAGTDWQATMIAGQHAVRGAEILLRRCPRGCLADSPDIAARVEAEAAEVAGAYRRLSEALRGGTASEEPNARGAGAGAVPGTAGTDRPPDAPTTIYAVDVAVWLAGLRDDLIRSRSRSTPPS